MMKIVKYIVLIVAASVFTYTVIYSPYQEILFQMIPGEETMSATFSSVAFFYTGLGLVTALLIGLMDRTALLMRIKKVTKEKQVLSEKCSELKSLLAEDRSETDA